MQPLVKRISILCDNVDAALERLEDAFAARERDVALAGQGEQAVVGQARTTAQAILDRSVRPRGQRFRRAGLLTPGYSVAEVDAVADRIAAWGLADEPRLAQFTS